MDALHILGWAVVVLLIVGPFLLPSRQKRRDKTTKYINNADELLSANTHVRDPYHRQDTRYILTERGKKDIKGHDFWAQEEARFAIRNPREGVDMRGLTEKDLE